MCHISTLPFCEQAFGLRGEGSEFGVREDGRLHIGDGQLQLRVAAVFSGLEEDTAHPGQHIPKVLQRINVSVRYAAAQVGIDVLQVFRIRAVNIAR